MFENYFNDSYSYGDVLVQSDDVIYNEQQVSLMLTDEYLVRVETEVGLFKNKKVPHPRSLSELVIVDGIAKVEVKIGNGGWDLIFTFKNGFEVYNFGSRKSEADLFEERAKSILPKTKVEDQFLETIKDVVNVAGVVGSAIGNKIGKKFGVDLNLGSQNNSIVTTKCVCCHAPLSGKKGQKVICKYCDNEQVL